MRGNAIRGALYVLLGNLPGVFLNSIASLIAGRILGPTSFGTLNLAQAVYGVSTVVTSAGLATYILRNPDTTDRSINVAWTASAVRGLLLACALWVLAAPLISLFGGEAQGAELLRALAVGHFLAGLSNLHVLRFAHQLRFRMVALLDSLGVVSTHVVALGCLLHWRTPIAYAIGLSAGRAIATLTTWAAVRAWPRPTFDRAELHSMWRFTRFLTLNSVITYGMLNGDNLIVSRLGGPRALGIYAMAFQMANAATLIAIRPLWKVLIPVFGRLRKDSAVLARVVEKTIFAFAACAVCFSVVAWTFAPEGFRLLDETGKWDDAVPVFRALCAFAVIRAMNQVMGQAMVTLGKPEYLTVLAGVQLAFLIPTLWTGYAIGGLVGVAFAMTVLAAIAMLALFFMAPRLMPISVWKLLSGLVVPIPIAMAAAALGWLVASAFEQTLLRLLGGGLVSAICFAGAWEVFCRSPRVRAAGFSSLAGIARDAFARRASQAAPRVPGSDSAVDSA